jgi:hypothetical protein
VTWFRIDDQLPSHEKTLRLPRGARRLQAIGAFTLLGAWSSGHLTDGRLPDAVFGELGIPKRVVEDLIAAGFIDRCPPGTEFFQIDLRLHDFLDWNLSSEQVLSERAAAAERQRRARDAAKAKRAAEQAKRDAEAPPPSEGEGESHAVTHGVTNGVTHGEVTPAVTVPPTRPDPTIRTNGHLGKSAPVGNAPEGGVPGAAESIVIEWTDRCDRMPPGKVINGVGVEVAQMLREGVDPDHIREGLAAWARRGGLGPGVLPSFVNDVMNRPAGQVALRNGTNGQAVSTTDQRVGAGLALAAKLRAQEESQ